MNETKFKKYVNDWILLTHCFLIAAIDHQS